MNHVRCTKCGEQATTKCLFHRTIFPTGESARTVNMLRAVLTVEYEPDGKYKTQDLVARLTISGTSDEVVDGKPTILVVQGLYDTLGTYLKYFDKVMCEHAYEYTDPRDSGCCASCL